jgi:hypothetical protein
MKLGAVAGTMALQLMSPSLAPPNIRSDDSEDELNSARDEGPSKVPEVTLIFWIIKIAATTVLACIGFVPQRAAKTRH